MKKTTTQRAGYVPGSYLTTVAQIIEPVKRRSYQLMNLGDGGSYLDAGCGNGIDVAAIGRLLGPAGQVVGIDYDHTMMGGAVSAQERPNRCFACASVYALPFPDSRFDAVRSERLFQHLQDPLLALEELVRVTRPGGSLVLADSDHGSLVIACSDHAVEHALTSANVQRLANGYSGRSLIGLMHQAALQEVTLELFAMHVTSYAAFAYLLDFDTVCRYAIRHEHVTDRQVSAFIQDLQERERQGAFFAAITMMLVRGKKTS